MARKNNNLMLDENGVEIGTEMLSNETIEKSFTLSRNSNWPTEIVEGKERPVQLTFKCIIDMTNIMYSDVLDDAIRTKIITLQNALRGTGKNQTPFEVLQEMAKQPIHRHYNTVGSAPENPNKLVNDLKASVANLTPEMRQKLLAELANM